MINSSSNMLSSLYSALPLTMLYPLPGVTCLMLIPHWSANSFQSTAQTWEAFPKTPQVDSGTLPTTFLSHVNSLPLHSPLRYTDGHLRISH